MRISADFAGSDGTALEPSVAAAIQVLAEAYVSSQSRTIRRLDVDRALRVLIDWISTSPASLEKTSSLSLFRLFNSRSAYHDILRYSRSTRRLELLGQVQLDPGHCFLMRTACASSPKNQETAETATPTEPLEVVETTSSDKTTEDTEKANSEIDLLQICQFLALRYYDDAVVIPKLVFLIALLEPKALFSLLDLCLATDRPVAVISLFSGTPSHDSREVNRANIVGVNVAACTESFDGTSYLCSKRKGTVLLHYLLKELRLLLRSKAIFEDAVKISGCVTSAIKGDKNSQPSQNGRRNNEPSNDTDSVNFDFVVNDIRQFSFSSVPEVMIEDFRLNVQSAYANQTFQSISPAGPLIIVPYLAALSQARSGQSYKIR